MARETDEAFVQHLTRAHNSLRSYISVHVMDIGVAEDILQNVSMILWRKRAEYQSDRPFLNWALGIARYEILQSRRQAARSKLIFDADMAEHLADRCEALEPELEKRRHALMSCLNNLSGTNRKLIELRYEKKLPMAEVAGAIGRNLNAVTVALSRIRDTLRVCVDRFVRTGNPALQESE